MGDKEGVYGGDSHWGSLDGHGSGACCLFDEVSETCSRTPGVRYLLPLRHEWEYHESCYLSCITAILNWHAHR